MSEDDTIPMVELGQRVEVENPLDVAGEPTTTSTVPVGGDSSKNKSKNNDNNTQLLKKPWVMAAIGAFVVVVIAVIVITVVVGNAANTSKHAVASSMCDGFDTSVPFHDDYTVASLDEPMNPCVAPWDFAIAQARFANNSLEPNKLNYLPDGTKAAPHGDSQARTSCAHIQGRITNIPIPDGFMHNGIISTLYDEKLIMMETGQAIAEGTLIEREKVVDTSCNDGGGGPNVKTQCCHARFGGEGGRGPCTAVKAQPPACPYSYLYQSPSAMETIAKGQNVEGLPIHRFKNPHGPQFKRVSRQAHAKGTACLKGKFTVTPGLAEDYRQGLFKVPNASFDAIVRFSGQVNFAVKDLHDLKIKGMGVKVLGVDPAVYGPTLPLGKLPHAYMGPNAKKVFKKDTLLSYREDITGVVDLHAIAIKNVKDHHGHTALNAFITNDSFSYGNLFAKGQVLPNTRLPTEDLTDVYLDNFNYSYGSPAAFRFGNNSAYRWYWQPCNDPSGPGGLYDQNISDHVEFLKRLKEMPIDEPDWYYRVMVAALDTSGRHYPGPALTNGFEFCFIALLQDDPCRQSVENMVETWGSSGRSEVLARLKIMPQEVTYDGFCESLTFHPFRTLAEHFPLGSINRMRSAIYPFTQLVRIRLNCLLRIGPCKESNPYDFFGENRSRTKGEPGRDYPSAEFYAPGQFGMVGGMNVNPDFFHFGDPLGHFDDGGL